MQADDMLSKGGLNRLLRDTRLYYTALVRVAEKGCLTDLAAPTINRKKPVLRLSKKHI